MSLTILQSQMEMEIYQAGSQTPRGSIDLREEWLWCQLKISWQPCTGTKIFIYNMAFVVLHSSHSLKGVSQFTMIMWPLTPETSLVAYSHKWTVVPQNCSLLLLLYSPLVPTLRCHCKDFQVALGLAEPEIVK